MKNYYFESLICILALTSIVCCSSDDEIVLGSEYRFTQTIEIGDAYRYENSEYVKLDDEQLGSSMNAYLVGQLLMVSDTPLVSNFFKRLTFFTDSTGVLVSPRDLVMENFTYSVRSDLVVINTNESGRRLFFKLLDGGEKLQNCMHHISEISLNPYQHIETLSLEGCDNANNEEAIQSYISAQSPTVNGLGIIRIIHNGEY